MPTILVADDDRDIRDLVRLVLESADHDVVTVGDGAEALGTLADRDFDLVLLDDSMPRARGLDVLRASRPTTRCARTRFLVLTALATRADVRACRAAGADDVLAKPFSPVELLERVRVLLATDARGAEPVA